LGNYPFEGERSVLNEYAWRYNRRDSRRSMFHDLLTEAVERGV
jgi:hypothetical protein